MPDCTILIVDDVETNRVLLREILKKRGYQVVEAANGYDAVEILKREEIDLALLDIMMPGMDGVELCRKMRGEKGPAEFPILFVTAKADDTDLATGLAAGANDYVTKPINATILLARVEAQLRLLQATRAIRSGYERLGQRKRMETVGLFAAGVAHNFNNILGTIMGSAELIQLYGNEDPQTAKAVELINRAGQRGAELTEALLTFTRPAEGMRCNNPVSVLQAAVVMLPLVSGSRVRFELKLPPDVPPIQISPACLSHIVGELLQNAVDAIDGDGVVCLSAHVAPPISGSRPSLAITVSDTGRGMTAETAQRLFEPFYSTKNLDTVLGIALDGSGLGLSVVYNLLESACGDIRVIETGKNGTVIEVRLPTAERIEISGTAFPS